MKIQKILSTMLLGVSLTLASCTQKPAGDTEKDPDFRGEWTQDIKDTMNEVIGEVLPYVNLKGNVTCGYNDTYGMYYVIGDSLENEALIPGYRERLVSKANYVEFDNGEEDFWTFTKVIEDTDTKYVENYVDLEMFQDKLWIGFEQRSNEGQKDWSDAQKAAMESWWGVVLPFPDMLIGSDELTFVEEQERFSITTYDSFSALSEVVTKYADELKELGFSGDLAEFPETEEDFGSIEGVFTLPLEGTKTIFGEEYNVELGVGMSVEYIFDYDSYQYVPCLSMAASVSAIAKTSTTWPENQIKTFLGENTTELPVLSGTSYEYVAEEIIEEYEGEIYDESVFTLKIIGVEQETFDDYIKDRQAEAYYVSDSYFTPWIEDYVVTFEYDSTEKEVVFYIYKNVEATISPTFPLTTVITEYYGDVFLTAEIEEIVSHIPTFEVDSEYGYKYYPIVFWGYLLGVAIDGIVESETFMADYLAALVSDYGFTLVEDEEYGDSYQYIIYDVAILSIEAAQNGNYFMFNLSFDEAPKSNVIDFSDEASLRVKDANESIWNALHWQMSVAKGASSTNVGNGSYFSNPLRVYTSQVVTFTWDEGYAPETITIACNRTSDATTVGNATIVGATASVSGKVVTLTLTEGATSVTITPSAQTRFDSVTFNMPTGE